jgi:hypothetical protein
MGDLIPYVDTSYEFIFLVHILPVVETVLLAVDYKDSWAAAEDPRPPPKNLPS